MCLVYIPPEESNKCCESTKDSQALTRIVFHASMVIFTSSKPMRKPRHSCVLASSTRANSRLVPASFGYNDSDEMS